MHIHIHLHNYYLINVLAGPEAEREQHGTGQSASQQWSRLASQI